MLTDHQIFEISDPFGAFEYGDAQGDKRRGFARAIESAAIDAFLARTGKYLTNDASREAAIADATAPLLAQIAELEKQLKTEQCLSFRDQVAQLEAQLAEARTTMRSTAAGTPTERKPWSLSARPSVPPPLRLNTEVDRASGSGRTQS